MAIRFKLGGYETVTKDPLGRGYVGYFPRMTEEEAWTAGRGVWKANREKISRQRFALVVGEGVVRAIAEITGHTEHETATGIRIALTGTLLPEGHPVREAYLGRPDPVATGSQNPVGYAELPEEKPYLMRPCGCGCGDQSDRDFLPGHDVRAIQARVREMFGGSALKLIEFLDAHQDPDRVARGLTTVTEELLHTAEHRGPTPRAHVPGAPDSPVTGDPATLHRER